MKFIVTLLFLFITTFSYANSTDSGAKCNISPEDSAIMELIGQFEKQSKFNAQNEAKKFILQQCQKFKDDGNSKILIKNNKIRFTQYSDSYNVNDPAYFCKNNQGYTSYLSRISQKMNLFKREKEKEEYKKTPKRKKPSRTYSSTKKAKVKIWECINPFSYIKKKSYLKKDHMLDHVNAHGADSCKPIN